jgi:hypothetical protein
MNFRTLKKGNLQHWIREETGITPGNPRSKRPSPTRVVTGAMTMGLINLQ